MTKRKLANLIMTLEEVDTLIKNYSVIKTKLDLALKTLKAINDIKTPKDWHQKHCSKFTIKYCEECDTYCYNAYWTIAYDALEKIEKM